MGCDICIYFEEKNYEGKWKEIKISPSNILPDGRYYQVWAFLFGVRNDEKWNYNPLFPFRGLPEDCSMHDVREDYEDSYSDLHSWTYVLASEVENIKWPDELKDCYFRMFLEYVFPLVSTTFEPMENHRMTVCFHC